MSQLCAREGSPKAEDFRARIVVFCCGDVRHKQHYSAEERAEERLQSSRVGGVIDGSPQRHSSRRGHRGQESSGLRCWRKACVGTSLRCGRQPHMAAATTMSPCAHRHQENLSSSEVVLQTMRLQGECVASASRKGVPRLYVGNHMILHQHCPRDTPHQWSCRCRSRRRVSTLRGRGAVRAIPQHQPRDSSASALRMTQSSSCRTAAGARLALLPSVDSLLRKGKYAHTQDRASHLP